MFCNNTFRQVPTTGENVLTQYNSDVIANGGSLSAKDITDLTSFVNYLQTNGVWSKLVDVGVFMGGYAGSITKLLYPDASIKSLSPTGFVSGDYSEGGGILSSVGTKYYDSLLAPASW